VTRLNGITIKESLISSPFTNKFKLEEEKFVYNKCLQTILSFGGDINLRIQLKLQYQTEPNVIKKSHFHVEMQVINSYLHARIGP
jgi:hypothetical protein